MGRSRCFDVSKALDRALWVFWRKGYEGATLPDLTRAMGINRPSLYAAFGNKEALFRKVLDRYIEGPAAYLGKALEEPTARATVEHLFHGVVDLLTDPRNPPGCLMVQGALACGKRGAVVRRHLGARRAAYEEALRKRFARAVADGEMPAGADPTALAKYIMVVIHGMAVHAASGASRKDLWQVAETAMQTWPTG